MDCKRPQLSKKGREVMSKRKYEKLFYRNRPERGALFIDGTYKENVNKEVHGVGFRGACQIPGSQANIGGSPVTEPIFIDPIRISTPQMNTLLFWATKQV